MSVPLGLFLVFLFVMLAVGGLLIVQRFIPPVKRRQHNDVAGFIYAVLGVAYAVLLGLMVIAVWEGWQEAESRTVTEATELSAVYAIAQGYPEADKQRVRERCREYARVVIDNEWPLLARGESSPAAWDALDDLRAAVLEFKPSSDTEQALYEQTLDRMHALSNARAERLLSADQGLPSILWFVLLVGGVIVVSFTYLFGMESTIVHTLMVASLALVIALVLFTVAALDFPFRGDVHIGPKAFQTVLERFDAGNAGGA